MLVPTMRTNVIDPRDWPIPLLAGFLLLLLQASPVAALETKILSLTFKEKPVRVFTQDSKAFIATGKGAVFRIGLKDGELVLVAEEGGGKAKNRPKGILPDGVVLYGSKDITAAWLTGATRRYDHGVLGDDVEATGLAVELAGGKRLELKLEKNSVFEDRLARLADLDGDGKDEIIAVRSYLDAGAALAVAKPGSQGLRIIAETRPIGIPHRWLNPVGVGDFDGYGGNEVARVKTPHIGGSLEIYALEKGRLRLKGEIRSFSNHSIGERELGKAAVIDADGDGVPEIILPEAGQRSLRILSFKGGRFSDLGRIDHEGSTLGTALAVTDLDRNGNMEIVYGLSDGRIMAVFFEP